MQISSDAAKATTNYAMSVITHNSERQSGIRIFNNPQFGEIRVAVGANNEPIFCASDLCSALGYSNSRDAVARHIDEDDVVKHDTIDSLGRNQAVTYVTESGMYSLVFGSKLESAKQFKRWVTSDILPTLRKTGTYTIAKQNNPKLQDAEVAVFLIREIKQDLRLNDASVLGMYQSLADPYGLAIPQYVPSRGILKSASVLLKEIGATMSAIKFNALLVAKGYLEEKVRPSVNGAVKKFKSITAIGEPYGENQVSPKNQKETQPQWYADKFRELYNLVTA